LPPKLVNGVSFNLSPNEIVVRLPYTASIGRIAGGYTLILNRYTLYSIQTWYGGGRKVYYHKNVIIGALVMVLPSMYPAAPATIHPTASPTMILAFLRNGEPKSSVRIMLTKERNPRPMNCGEPHL
jgi:hypothetical protein